MAKFASTNDLRLDVNIDISKYLKGAEDLEKVLPAIKRGVELGIHELCGRLQTKMMEYLIAYGLGDSFLMTDIRIIPHADGISVSVGQDYAIYVEYGTGIAGASHPHPQPRGWSYMVGKHSSKGGGWWYPTTSSDPNPIKFVSEMDGKLYAWTKAGQPSRPFMYKTWLWGTRSANQIIMKNIRKELSQIKGVLD